MTAFQPSVVGVSAVIGAADFESFGVHDLLIVFEIRVAYQCHVCMSFMPSSHGLWKFAGYCVVFRLAIEWVSAIFARWN